MLKSDAFFKRLFDISLSLVGLIFSSPIIFITWLIASLETKSNGFFIQKRVGKDKKIFKLVKIKTMRPVAGVNTTITSSNDVRITKSGSFFRKSKLDELPQLWNVLIGDMSFVGPRPDVVGYANMLKGEDRVILLIRPGITGPASIYYKNEEKLLSMQSDPKAYNDKVIWPDKVRINREYYKNYSFFKDIYYIWKTIVG